MSNINQCSLICSVEPQSSWLFSEASKLADRPYRLQFCSLLPLTVHLPNRLCLVNNLCFVSLYECEHQDASKIPAFPYHLIVLVASSHIRWTSKPLSPYTKVFVTQTTPSFKLNLIRTNPIRYLCLRHSKFVWHAYDERYLPMMECHFDGFSQISIQRLIPKKAEDK
jgi:hypothetical protein